jgi:hypothetical protein
MLSPDIPKPRFQLADRVVVTGPVRNRGKRGLVMELVQKPGDAVVRYRVRFADGTSATFFGFELELREPG